MVWGVTGYIYNLWVSLQWTRICNGMMTVQIGVIV